MELETTNGFKFLIDVEDFEAVKKYSWRVKLHESGYRSVKSMNNILGKKSGITLSHFLLGATEDKFIDHKNRDSLDNRRLNLRICTREENMHNRGPNKKNKSGYKGVIVKKTKGSLGEYVYIFAKISVEGKVYRSPCMYSLEDAARAYNEMAIKFHGNFAFLNDVPSTHSLLSNTNKKYKNSPRR